jgi:phosphatidylserine/phosphatidylglycerophosphate/cardiolipin synthase-like enzyme
MRIEVMLSRAESVAARIERHIRSAGESIDAAIYRFNQPRLAAALGEAVRRGITVRLILDRNKYEESRSTRELLGEGAIPFRLLYGRQGAGSKMHHKFAVLDGRTVLTGSYNWTVESEEQNFENLLLLDEWEGVELYKLEFEALWAEATPPV